jgi:hypothetical protein
MARPRDGEGGRPHGITSAIREAKKVTTLSRVPNRWTKLWVVTRQMDDNVLWFSDHLPYQEARGIWSSLVVEKALRLLGLTPSEVVASRLDEGGSVPERVTKHYRLMQERRSQS